jgi:hypothetical protein
MNTNQTLIDASINRLKKSNSDNTVFVSPEELGLRKMSEIILEYAEEFLKLTDTRSEKEDVIELAIAAWNIALADADKRFNLMDHFISDVCGVEKNSDHWKRMVSVLIILINKKLEEYPLDDRPILDYEFVKLNSGGYHLNIISGIEITE